MRETRREEVMPIARTYAALIGKSWSDIEDFWKAEGDEDRFALELLCANEWIEYTRYALVMSGQTEARFTSVTSRTCLQVPISEVPSGALVKLANQRSEAMRFEVVKCDGSTFYMLFDADGLQKILHPWEHVRVQFYCARDGVYVGHGDHLWCTIDELERWRGTMIAIGFKVPTIEELVAGCKFDMWGCVHYLKTGRHSVFTPEYIRLHTPHGWPIPA